MMINGDFLKSRVSADVKVFHLLGGHVLAPADVALEAALWLHQTKSSNRWFSCPAIAIGYARASFLHDPDIPELHRVCVALELDVAFGNLRQLATIAGSLRELDVVVDLHAVLNDRHAGV